jgi:tetratricopeptide (TPR) repeat protein
MSSYDNAIRSFQESVNFDPSDAAVFAGMGRAYEAKSDFVQAVSAFKKALDLQPSSEEYRTDLERAEKELSAQNEETERLERDILSKEKVLLGRAALGLGDLEESWNRFLQALDLMPRRP